LSPAIRRAFFFCGVWHKTCAWSSEHKPFVCKILLENGGGGEEFEQAMKYHTKVTVPGGWILVEADKINKANGGSKIAFASVDFWI
jgi:hypothetical protein